MKLREGRETYSLISHTGTTYVFARDKMSTDNIMKLIEVYIGE